MAAVAAVQQMAAAQQAIRQARHHPRATAEETLAVKTEFVLLVVGVVAHLLREATPEQTAGMVAQALLPLSPAFR